MLVAQQKNDYNLLLKTGNFIPVENGNSLEKNQQLFLDTKFGNSYYVGIQFWSLPDDANKKMMADAGIRLIDYLPNLAYTATLPVKLDALLLRSFNIRSVFTLRPDQKAMPWILNGPVPVHAVKQAGFADINVLTYDKLSMADVWAAFNSSGAVIISETPVFRTFTVRIPAENISRLAALPFVQWLEFIAPPNQAENLPGRTLHRASILNDGVRNLKGDGVNVGIWDGGAISPHIDFSPSGRVVQVEPGAFDSHSTHCSGTICGRGLINPIARGMAPNATLYSYNYNGDIQAEMAADIPAKNLSVSSHSYNDGLGVQCGLTGANSAYSLVSRNTDINLNNNPGHLHVHSAGNNQTSCAGGWTTITGSGKSAKNNLVVAAISSTEAMTTFSSFGPVSDGRIKPEISAMGLNVFSTYTPLNTYGTISGTSMSTPGAAGTVTLLVQAYKQLNGGTAPPSSLIKNIVCNSAKDLGNPGPDYKFGFGCINALQAVRILEQNRYVVNSISTTAVQNTTINVPAGASRLRVMITWNDPAGTANANPALVNNLDLSVINGTTTTLPWKLDPNNPATIATRGVDNISNIEQVTIDNPPAGIYTLSVSGTAIPMGPQQYSLTWTIDEPGIEVIYPNGGESFNPGSSETITWDNSGVTGTQTVAYSLDNGANWTNISTIVPATTTRLAWTIPTANTAAALIRVTSGALTDVSDANFKILGTTTGFAVAAAAGCNSGEIKFVWNTVSNATNYDIYNLDNTSGNFVILAANVTGTTYTATGLTPGASIWFTIIAKNSTTNAASERAIAINGTVSSGGGGLGVVGSISGQAAVCGIASNVPYSIAAVAGATTYTWTAPPGTNIASGQGTNSITVNYLAGSANGSVAVFAGNGTCQTNTASLPITVNSSSVAAPVSAGNQSQTVCPGGNVATLTASATVPAGFTVIWYTAATGGTLVANPVLSVIGSITYFAASQNNVSGCEGSSRTAVTLSITSVPSPTITAGSSTTFCQGGSVVLTANTGSSYSWMKDGQPIGTNAQTLTATDAGTYTVMVITGTCTGISAPVVVTVNPLPIALITTTMPTAICQGGQVTLTASAGSSWLWSNAATTQSISATETGNYSVTVTNSGNCTAVSAATVVTVSPNPTVTINASPYTNLYPGLITTLTANTIPTGSYLYTWFKNGTVIAGATSSTLPGIRVYDLGSYTVSVTNLTGLPCGNSSVALLIGDSATSKLFIYPSPGTGQFKVNYYSPGTNVENTLKIYDSKGALVYTQTFAISTSYQVMDVDMRRNSKGVYRVALFDRNGKKLAMGSVVLL